MTSFVDKLRMRNIYPSAGLGPPDMDGAFNKTFNELYPIQKNNEIQQQNQQWNAEAQNKMEMQKQGNLAEVAKQAQMKQTPQNVVFNDMTPYQRGTLDFKKQELASKDALGRDKLAVTDENADNKLNIAQQRADIYDFKAKNPNKKIVISKGGNFMLVDPISGDVKDTGVHSGTMSEAEKLEITGDQAIANIHARGDESQETQKMRNEGSLAQIAARVSGQKEVNAAKPNRGELPTQTKVRQGNAARELTNTRPDLAKFITVNSDGSIAVTAPNPSAWFDGGRGPTAEQHAEINRIIFGSGSTSTTTPPKTTDTKPAATSTTSAVTPPVAPAGWKYVPKAGGGWTAVEDKKK